RKIGDTEYGVKLIPFGGYIRMIGMFPPKKDEEYGRTASSAPWRMMIEDAREAAAEEVTPEDQHRQFYQRKPWKRIIVMVAGPVMNLILAVGIFAAILMGHGIQQGTTTVSSVSECVLPATADTTQCPPGAPPSPAAAAGFRPGDRIVEFNGRSYESWEDLQLAIRESSGTVSVVVERDGQLLTLHPTLLQTERPKLNSPSEYETVGFLGLTPTMQLVKQDLGGVVETIGGFVSLTAQKVVELPQRIPDLVSAIAGGEREQDTPVSIVGASRLGGEVLASEEFGGFDDRIMVMFNLLAGVNLSLFVLNMLPILPLDGGHIAGALWESVRRGFAKLTRRPDPGPFDTAKLMPLAYAVSLLFIAYSLLIVVADIVNPVTFL
ncbi:MAG: site-2 protease family protein, partial [Saccharopolyspora rectivirgula]